MTSELNPGVGSPARARAASEQKAGRLPDSRSRAGPNAAPIVAFSAVYAVTCLVGAVFLLANEPTFVALFEYYSGTQAPDLSPAEVRIDVTLLLVAPTLLIIGFFVGARILQR